MGAWVVPGTPRGGMLLGFEVGLVGLWTDRAAVGLTGFLGGLVTLVRLIGKLLFGAL